MGPPVGNVLSERCPECDGQLEIDLVVVGHGPTLLLYDVTCRTCFWSDQRHTVPLRLSVS